MTAPPRVALVDPSLFTPPYDAALSDGLGAVGVPHVWAVRPTRRDQREMLPPLRVRAIFYRHVDDSRWIPRKLRKAAKALSHVVGLWRLLRLVSQEDIDVVHFQWAVVPLMDALAMRLLRRHAGIVITVHDTTPFNGDRLNALQHLGYDLPIRMADHVIAHTESGCRNLKARGIPGDRISVIPHGPLALRIADDERLPRPAIRDSRHTFTLFGQIKPYKGVDLMIEAVARLSPTCRAASRFVVAGATMMDTTTIEARTRELGLNEVIAFRFGRLSEPELDALFDETDTFLFPYREVDASGAYYTVRSLDKWIIASRVGVFVEDFVENQDGRTIPPGDIDALAAAIEDASSAQAGRTTGLVGDAWPRIATQTLAVYQDARARHWSGRATTIGSGLRTKALGPLRKTTGRSVAQQPMTEDPVEGDGPMSKPRPSIAVIVTCFNYERFVAAAIDSALAQTRPADEVIVIDDGSTDGSAAILQGYAKKITLIRQVNAGQTQALRTAFAASSADIIQLLDADDRLLPEALALVEQAWTEGASKVQFDLEIIDDRGMRLGRRFCNFPEGYDEETVATSFARTATYQWPVTSGNAYSRRLMQDGLQADIPLSADGVLNTIAPLYGSVRTIVRPLGEYRHHGNNISHDAAFASIAVPPFARRIEQRRQEVAVLADYAQRIGRLLPKADPLDHEIAFVNYRLITKRLGLHHSGINADQTAQLWGRGIVLGWQSGGSARHRLQHLAWFTALALAPAASVRTLVALRFGRTRINKAVKEALSWQS